MKRHLVVLTIATALSVLSTAACSSAPDTPTKNESQVATLQSSAPVATKSAEQEKAPRYRLDDTAADRLAKLEPYDKCMRDHGVDVMRERQGKVARSSDSKIKEAGQACDPLLPLVPWEEDPANPEAKDFARDVVACLKGKGVKEVELNDEGTGWSYGGTGNDSESIDKGMALAPTCEREVADTRQHS